MTQIQLRVYRDPGQAEVFLNTKRKDGGYDKRAAIVDTGAQISLLPSLLMEMLDYRLSERGSFMVEQAGIAEQSFEAVEAYITVFLEDDTGNRTDDFEILVWFAGTREVLLGFYGVLDRAILHLDTPNLTGYLNFS
ncbi:MAG TPA: hypothetical protein VHP83_27060 [Aggregatilineaceae bacterium]|nr:hypothetical protein [Aggregatilineaceae bacterium]